MFVTLSPIFSHLSGFYIFVKIESLDVMFRIYPLLPIWMAPDEIQGPCRYEGKDATMSWDEYGFNIVVDDGCKLTFPTASIMVTKERFCKKWNMVVEQFVNVGPS